MRAKSGVLTTVSRSSALKCADACKTRDTAGTGSPDDVAAHRLSPDATAVSIVEAHLAQHCCYTGYVAQATETCLPRHVVGRWDDPAAADPIAAAAACSYCYD